MSTATSINEKKIPLTGEEHKRLDEIVEEQNRLVAELGTLRSSHNKIRAEGGDTSQVDEELQQKSDRLYALEGEANRIFRHSEDRYIKSHSKAELLADAEELVSSITLEDFLEHLKFRERVYRDAEASLPQTPPEGRERAYEDMKAYVADLKAHAIASYENCYRYILLELRVQLNAFADDPEGTAKIESLIDKRVSQWYVKTQPAFLPMAHAKATDAFAFMSTRNAEVNRITGNATINKLGVELVILKMRELHATLGVSADKLLSSAIAVFTKQNDFRHTKDKAPKREVTISLKEYAKLLGYDVDEKDQLDNARRAIKKDLDVIHASVLKWEEPIKGKTRDFERISLVTRTAIRRGNIEIDFTPEIASYLAERNLITQYPTKLLRLDSRKPTAYYIGRKLAEHYNIDNNQIRGTNDRISIPALLAVTDLPTYEEVQLKDRGHWENRIKRFFEEALDTLTQEGVLENWEYTHAKGVPLTDEEAQNITSYEEFSKLYLRFTLSDKIDHTERIRAKQEARAEASKQKKKKTTKRKS